MVIETAETDAAKDELDDDDVDEEEEEDDDDDDDDDEDDEDEDDRDTAHEVEGIDGPDDSTEVAENGKHVVIISPARLAEDVSGAKVSVVESTSGTTMSSDAGDIVIALVLGKSPPEVEGRIVSSPLLDSPLAPVPMAVLASPPSSVVLSHSVVMHFEFSGSICSSRACCDCNITGGDELIDESTTGCPSSVFLLESYEIIPNWLIASSGPPSSSVTFFE